jgi:hypothetical protein
MSNWHDACDLIKSEAREDYPHVPGWKGAPKLTNLPGSKNLSKLKMENLRGTTASQRKEMRNKKEKSDAVRASVGDVDKKYDALVAAGRAPKLVAGKTSGSSGETSGSMRAERNLSSANEQAGAITRRR